MAQLSPSLRKAAVLITALDERTAEALLQQMNAEDAAKVRNALVELENVPVDEQDQVLGEFLRAKNPPHEIMDDGGGVDLELTSAAEQAVDQPETNAPPPLPFRPVHQEQPSFDFLADVDAKAIAGVLGRELPQTVAVVVAHLPPNKAAEVLERLSPELATEALERMAWLDRLSPEVEADLVRELRRQLAPHIRGTSAGSAWLPHVSAVLGAMDYRQRQRLVLQLGQRNQPLLDRLGLFPAASDATEQPRVNSMRYRIESQPSEPTPRLKAAAKPSEEQPWLTFEDLVNLDDRALRGVFAAADTEMALLALTGAEPRLISRILRKLPVAEAAVLRNRLEHPGPLRLRDVEQARLAVAAVASRLAHEGSIEIPASVRFAAAV